MTGSPLPGERAFAEGSPSALWSQAGQLVMLGAQLTGDTEVLDPDEARFLDVPRVPPLRAPFGPEDAERMLRGHARALGAPALEYEYARGGALAAVGTASAAGVAELRRRLWLTARRESGTIAAAAAATLVHVAAAAREEVLRVPASAEAMRLVAQPDRRLLDNLADGRSSDSPLLSALAVDALVRAVGPAPDSAGDGLSGGVGPRRPSDHGVSVILHGTWSRMSGSWWRPGGDLFQYLRRTVTPNLYTEPDYFRWEGFNTAASRSQGAGDLIRWSKLHGGTGFDTVFAHSHGGNVLLEAAARGGMRAKLAVLMSVPVYRRDAAVWSAIGNNINRLVSLRVHCDLVVIAARGRQRFGPPVVEIPVPGVWFDHHATVRPEVWKEHRLAGEIHAERRLAELP